MQTFISSDGTASLPGLAYTSQHSLGMYRAGPDQNVFVDSAGRALDVGNFTIANLEATPKTVRYAARPYARALGSAVETCALYVRTDHAQVAQNVGIYIEVDAAQGHTDGSGLKIIHNGSGDAAYIAVFGATGVGQEVALFGPATNATAFLASAQAGGLSNAIAFNALWDQETVPNYGLFVATKSAGNALTISPRAGTDPGQVQIRITQPNYGAPNVFEVFTGGETHLCAPASTALSPLNASPEIHLRASGWDGAAAQNRDAILKCALGGVNAPELDIYLGDPAGPTQVFTITTAAGMNAQELNFLAGRFDGFGLGLVRPRAEAADSGGTGRRMLTVPN